MPPRDPVAARARAEQMRARRLAGATYREIGQEHGLTQERVRQILAVGGLTDDARDRTRDRATVSRKIGELLARSPRTAKDLCHTLHITKEELHKAIRPQDRERLLDRNDRKLRLTDEQVLEGLRVGARRRARMLDRPGPVSLPYAWWNAHRDRASTLPSGWVAHRFGDWESGCRQAGVHVPPVVQDAARWSAEDAEWWLTVYLDRLRTGRVKAQPVPADFDDWARSDPRVPSAAVVTALLGDWRTALQIAREP